MRDRCLDCGGSGYLTTYSYHQTHSTPHLHNCQTCNPPPLTCADCRLRYDDPAWCDVVLTDEDWLSISPTGHHGGVLCFTCIVRRLVKRGRSNVPMMVTSGPFQIRTEREGLPKPVGLSGRSGS